MKTKIVTAVLYLALSITFFVLTTSLFAQHQVGHVQVDFVDTNRGGRVIQSEIYYPSNTAGESVPIATGQYPVIVFGHGFVMSWDAYQNIWENLVPNGYIMVFPRTEGNIFGTDHQQFGWDLQFLVSEMQVYGADASTPVYGGVAPETALMGHSMGGGAAFLAADSLTVNGNINLKALVGLAPAESNTNGVSSINSARSVTNRALIFSGQNDGVTPPGDHHIPMYDSLSSDCKTFVNVLGGAHCYFANPNFNCDFGESSASTGISITREQQHSVLFDLLNPWLDHVLKANCSAISTFQDSLMQSSRITFMEECNYTPLTGLVTAIDEVVGGDGSIAVNGSGGVPPYTYSIDGVNFQSTGNFDLLSSGTYMVTIEDAAGCQYTTSVDVNPPVATGVGELANLISVYPNPTNGIITVKTTEPIDAIIIHNIHGQQVYKSTSPHIGWYPIDLSKYDDGIYQLSIQQQEIYTRYKIIKTN